MNSDELIRSVKSRASIPTSQNLFTEAGILDIVNEEMHSRILPLLLKVQEEYYLTFKDYEASEFPIRVPSDAIGQKIRSLMVIDTQGRLANPIPRVSLENEYAHPTQSYRFESNQIHLHNFSALSDRTKIRMYYHRRPSKLVQGNRVSIVTSAAGNIVTVNQSFQGLDTNSIVDVGRNDPPFDPFLVKQNVLAVTPSSVELNSAEGIEAGMVISLAGTSYYPGLPLELHELLAQAAAMKCLESQGKPTEMAAASGVYQIMEQNALYLLTPRSDGTPKKALPGRGISAYV